MNRRRLDRLARRVEARCPPPPDENPFELWLPANPRDPRPPGRYPMHGANAVLVIYDAEEETPRGGEVA